MQARDPNRDRPAGAPGRPAFGIGPIARVSRPPAPRVPVAAPSVDRRDHVAAAATGTPLGRSGFGTGVVGRPPMAMPPVRGGFGLPNLRRNVCPHFYMTGTRGAIPIQAPHLLKALIRQDANISRCQLRGGVHLEQGYVNDVCLTPRFNQCVFYEDDLTRE
jgi:hypothetical protein